MDSDRRKAKPRAARCRSCGSDGSLAGPTDRDTYIVLVSCALCHAPYLALSRN